MAEGFQKMALCQFVNRPVDNFKLWWNEFAAVSELSPKSQQFKQSSTVFPFRPCSSSLLTRASRISEQGNSDDKCTKTELKWPEFRRRDFRNKYMDNRDGQKTHADSTRRADSCSDSIIYELKRNLYAKTEVIFGPRSTEKDKANENVYRVLRDDNKRLSNFDRTCSIDVQRVSWSEPCKPDIHVELRSKTSTVRHNGLNSENTDQIHFISSSNVSPSLLLQRLTILPLVERLQSFSWRSESGTDVEPQWGKSKSTDSSPDPPMDVFRKSIYTPAIQHHNIRHNTEQKTRKIENISKESSAGKETADSIYNNLEQPRNTLEYVGPQQKWKKAWV